MKKLILILLLFAGCSDKPKEYIFLSVKPQGTNYNFVYEKATVLEKNGNLWKVDIEDYEPHWIDMTDAVWKPYINK